MSGDLPVDESLEIDFAAYNAFVEGMSLRGIEVSSLSAERLAGGGSPETAYSVESAYAKSDQDDQLVVRFAAVAKLLGDDRETVVAEVEVAVVAVYSGLPDGGVPEEWLGLYATTSVAVVLYPYLREIISSTALRIGYPGVFLPTRTLNVSDWYAGVDELDAPSSS